MGCGRPGRVALAGVLEHALGRSHTRNVGDIKQNTRDYIASPAVGRGALSHLRQPTAFVVEYVDGLRATGP